MFEGILMVQIEMITYVTRYVFVMEFYYVHLVDPHYVGIRYDQTLPAGPIV